MDFIEIYKDILVKRFKQLAVQDKRKLAVMSLERQFKSYCYFALVKNWNRSKEYRDLLDTCWKSILKKEQLSEEIWEFHEKIKPEYVNKFKEEGSKINISYGNIFAGNVMELIETLLDDKKYEEGFLLLNIDYIVSYLNESNTGQKYKIDTFKDNVLIINEIKNQEYDMKDKDKIDSFISAKKWYEKCKSLI